MSHRSLRWNRHLGQAVAALGLLSPGMAAAADVEPEMLRLPAGQYLMGSAAGEAGREGDEAPRHRVVLAKAFWVSRFEITEGQWKHCVAEKACPALRLALGDDHPVTGIGWKTAVGYAQWLSRRSGKPYRLLTEAEWEYAARAGSVSAFAGGASITPAEANYAASGVGRPRPVGQYAPNRFGLHDMTGNVWEWVADCYPELGYHEALADGSALVRENCQMHVVRGGAFDTRPEQLRLAYRNRVQFSGDNVGLRVAREDEP